MNSSPLLSLDVKNFLIKTAHLSTLELGALLLLMMNYWERRDLLPDSDSCLANIARMRLEEWASIRDIILEFFEKWGNHWINHELEKALSEFEFDDMD